MSVGLFEHEGVRFQFPENWAIQEQTAELRQLAVTVESPQGGFWSLQCLGPDTTPDDVAEQALETMRGEYEQLEASEFVDEEGDFPLVGFNLDFYCLDLVIQAHLRAFRANGQNYLMLYQAEDRDFEELLPVFSAITLTLMQSLSGQ